MDVGFGFAERAFRTILRMCVNFMISYPTVKFSKAIFVSKILVRRPCEACENLKLMLKTCLVIHERFKQHILCLELNIVGKYDVLKGAFLKQLEAKAAFTL